MFSDYMKNHSYNHISSYLPEIADRKLPDSYKTTKILEIGVHIYTLRPSVDNEKNLRSDRLSRGRTDGRISSVDAWFEHRLKWEMTISYSLYTAYTLILDYKSCWSSHGFEPHLYPTKDLFD